MCLRDTERDHIHATFIIAYRLHRSILLFVIVFNLLLYPTDKLNFIVDTCVQEKHGICRARYCGWFRPPGGLIDRGAGDYRIPIIFR